MITILETHDCAKAGIVLEINADREIPQIQRCAGIIESITLMPNGNYVVSGRSETNGIPPATVKQILTELEKL